MDRTWSGAYLTPLSPPLVLCCSCCRPARWPIFQSPCCTPTLPQRTRSACTHRNITHSVDARWPDDHFAPWLVWFGRELTPHDRFPFGLSSAVPLPPFAAVCLQHSTTRPQPLVGPSTDGGLYVLPRGHAGSASSGPSDRIQSGASGTAQDFLLAQGSGQLPRAPPRLTCARSMHPVPVADFCCSAALVTSGLTRCRPLPLGVQSRAAPRSA